jgi:DNA-binding MarR family transcriptional regulator
MTKMEQAKRPRRAASRDDGNDATSFDRRILNAIRQIIRAADIDSRRLAAEHQITAPQLMCLMAVVEKGTASAADIAKRIHLSPSTLVGVLDRLESKGFIRRKPDAEDRRRTWVTASKGGAALVGRIPFPLQYSLDRALNQLPEAARRETADCIERLVSLMGADNLPATPMLEIVAVNRRRGQPTK